MKLFALIATAALAVFGTYCLLRLLGDSVFSSRHTHVAVTVADADALDRLEQLLMEAHGVFFRSRRMRLIVLLDRSLVGADDHPDKATQALLARFHADCYVVEHHKP